MLSLDGSRENKTSLSNESTGIRIILVARNSIGSSTKASQRGLIDTPQALHAQGRGIVAVAMLDAVLLLVPGLTTSAGALVIVGLLREMRDASKAQRIERVPLNRLWLGLVEVTGRIQPTALLLASPLSRQRCVQLTLTVDGRQAFDSDWLPRGPVL